ncbi:MAG: TRAP transporter large permease subunit [Thermoleophilia bacterium]|nr:TRAP transporter large permease subunit [Thermoleophilia bacterium]
MGLDPTYVSLVAVGGLVVLMFLGVPIVYSLGFSSVVAALLGYGAAGLFKAGASPFTTAFNLSWTALPLFVLLGTIIASSGMGEGLFKAAANWLSRVRGGLVAAGIVGEGVLAAALGTSAATIIVVGKVAVPEFERQGYKRGFGLGALLAGGALGPLIPPSATFIIYGVIAGESIGKLFIAGLVPGILLVAFLALPAIGMSYAIPGLAPKGYKVSWRDRCSSLKGVWPIIVIMVSILGCIYAGIATATETAGVGVVVALIIAVAFYKMRWKQLKEALREAALINGMILFIIIAANFFTYVIGSTNVASGLENLVGESGLSRYVVIVLINVLVLALGMFIDPITITLLTVPIFVPLIVSLGFDPIWFGVMFCINTQIGLITPPMGTDLFAVKTIFNIPTSEIIRGVAPFLAFELVFLGIIVAFPELSLWLPSAMIGK